MSFDFDQIVENHFNERRDVFGFESIAQLIEEVMQECGDGIKLLGEGNVPTSESFDWSMIPEIPISELGWSQQETRDEGPVAGPQRKVLEDYLNNIVEEGTLQQKLASLGDFMQHGDETISGTAETPGKKISAIVSYLVFYKTLTRVITNFNASSAGFSFESFLAVLLGGAQIPTGTDTIADFTTTGAEGGKEYISLKLYSEKGVEVGGSFADLVDDLTSSEKEFKMKYLVVLKSLRGKGLDQEGTLTFYEFTFDLNNIAAALLKTGPESQSCIILPLVVDKSAPSGYRLALPKSGQEVPGRTKVSATDINNLYMELATAALTPAEEIIPNLAATVLGDPNFQVQDDGKLVFGASPSPVAMDAALLDLYQQGAESDHPLNTAERREGDKQKTTLSRRIARALVGAYLQAIQQLKKDPEAARKAQVAELVPALESGDVVTSVEWYNSLPKTQQGMALRMKALRVSNGYLNNLHFKLGKSLSTGDKEVADMPVTGVGQIQIGAKWILPMIERFRDELNDEVYSIFTSLKLLSSSLNEYFATGLKDGDKAGEAIAAADNIEQKTVKSVEKFGTEEK